jgi:hypothetical protein
VTDDNVAGDVREDDEDLTQPVVGVFEPHDDAYRMPYTRLVANHNEVVELAE